MAAGGHFAFWMSEKSLSVAFLDISDKYETFFLNFFTKWPPAAGGHFECPKITFGRNSG